MRKTEKITVRQFINSCCGLPTTIEVHPFADGHFCERKVFEGRNCVRQLLTYFGDYKVSMQHFGSINSRYLEIFCEK